MSKITDHLAWPGPMYWDFKCRICDGNVDDHSFWGYVWQLIKKWGKHDR